MTLKHRNWNLPPLRVAALFLASLWWECQGLFFFFPFPSSSLQFNHKITLMTLLCSLLFFQCLCLKERRIIISSFCSEEWKRAINYFCDLSPLSTSCLSFCLSAMRKAKEHLSNFFPSLILHFFLSASFITLWDTQLHTHTNADCTNSHAHMHPKNILSSYGHTHNKQTEKRSRKKSKCSILLCKDSGICQLKVFIDTLYESVCLCVCVMTAY